MAKNLHICPATGKVKHWTIYEAARERFRLVPKVPDSKDLMIFKCHDCGKYHIGGLPKNRVYDKVGL